MSNDNGTNNENKGTYFPELDYEARGHTPFGTRMEKAAKDGGDDMISPEQPSFIPGRRKPLHEGTSPNMQRRRGDEPRTACRTDP
jgi:hypothetical protein